MQKGKSIVSLVGGVGRGSLLKFLGRKNTDGRARMLDRKGTRFNEEQSQVISDWRGGGIGIDPGSDIFPSHQGLSGFYGPEGKLIRGLI